MKNMIGMLFLSGTLCLTACHKKDIYYFNTMSPPHQVIDKVEQRAEVAPPLYLLKKSRSSIKLQSQYFTLAIPNCIDMTGMALDLRKSVADMLYTEVFKTHRFNLVDRGQLQELDSAFLEDVFFKRKKTVSTESGSAGNDPEKDQRTKMINKKSDEDTKKYVEGWQMLKGEKMEEEQKTKKLQNITDGLLLVYITSKIADTKKKKGKIQLEYRIVSTRDTVLFAGTHKVDFMMPTKKDIAYNRDDLTQIANEIFQIFPNPGTTRKAEIISVDLHKRRIVMDFGKNNYIIPGLRGFVATIDDSIYTSDDIKAQHYKYLAVFEITEVYDKTSVGHLIRPGQPDIQIGDKVVLK